MEIEFILLDSQNLIHECTAGCTLQKQNGCCDGMASFDGESKHKTVIFSCIQISVLHTLPYGIMYRCMLYLYMYKCTSIHDSVWKHVQHN